ncbi:hypothetical protein SAM40697_3032 [Streptomyces ambofaciens]|uniref:Uncharacterized protein n=1 Tax=Streptomyces ambofaciens TaxID=1889 RepID=A0ABN4P737_STRAM|nr:hypothetical protein SAM40697_3032 [Streptomyces ambofaciens]
MWRDPVEVKARIGVLPEGRRLFERLSGREPPGCTGRLRGLPGTEVGVTRPSPAGGPVRAP